MQRFLKVIIPIAQVSAVALVLFLGETVPYRDDAFGLRSSPKARPPKLEFSPCDVVVTDYPLY